MWKVIDFACRRFDIDEIIKCALGLTKADLIVLKFLMGNEGKSFTSEEISEKLKLDITTVQRAVKKLSENNVLGRNQKNLNLGGYVFLYQIKSRKAIRELVMGIVNKWVSRVESELKEIA